MSVRKWAGGVTAAAAAFVSFAGPAYADPPSTGTPPPAAAPQQTLRVPTNVDNATMLVDLKIPQYDLDPDITGLQPVPSWSVRFECKTAKLDQIWNFTPTARYSTGMAQVVSPDMSYFAGSPCTVSAGKQPVGQSASFTVNQDFGIGIDGDPHTVQAIIDGTVTIAPPTTADHTYSTSVGRPLTVDAANGLLANAVFPGGRSGWQPIHLGGERTSHGDIYLNPDGSFTYTPDFGFTGNDVIQYHLYNSENTAGGSWSNGATVTIHVGP